MGNLDLARRLIDDVRAAGVDEFCVCAGSRNSPLLAVLGELRGYAVAQLCGVPGSPGHPVSRETGAVGSPGHPVSRETGQLGDRATPVPRDRATAQPVLYSFIDERSATFFALGRAKLHGNPVAVVTTSGTAVAEMLAGTIEAYYSGIPLILISADRPARYRGTGAPQSIEQVGLFGVYAETSLEAWTRTKPLHLNIEFDEPLLGNAAVPAAERAASSPPPARGATPLVQPARTPAFRKPLVLIGGLAARHRDFVRERIGDAPFYAEPLSGLRHLATITAGERMLGRGDFDGVIRIGNVPTLRFWRDLETLELPVVHYSDLPFTGLTRGELHPIESLSAIEPAASFPGDAEIRARIEAILDAEPQSELAMIRALSRELPADTRVYLGNSLPIREWDLAAERKPFDCEANRGANGIDGQLSTFFGWCDPSRDNVCLIGDLTAIYDLGAPWIVPQLGHRRFRIVIVNNGGGRIFGRVASLQALDAGLRERIIENAHDVRFDQWAAMWNIDVTELRPDAESSRRAWKSYDALWI